MIKNIINGDLPSFDIFYSENVTKVYNYFFQKVASTFVAEELTQLSFIKFWRYKDSLSESLPAGVQLFHKARLVYIDWLRKEATQRKYFSADPLNDEAAPVVQSFKEEDEDFKSVRAAMDQLPNMQRKVLTLFYLEEKSYKEIAELLGVSVKTVDNHLYQAIKKLRKVLPIITLFIRFFL